MDNNSQPRPSKLSPSSRTSSQDRMLSTRGYSIGDVIGEGTYAQVYTASFADPKKEKQNLKLACKVINFKQLSKNFSQKFFPREIEILSRISHPQVVRVHSILQRRQHYYIFMEYAEHGDVLDFILQHGAIKERQAGVWFSQVIKGLKYLHDKDIAHRDMKCENLLLTAGFNIKISDFGFARYTVDKTGNPVISTTYCGSVTYSAPEIIKGVPYVPKLADIWSLGVILFIMLNKSWPFDPSNLSRLYESQLARRWKIRAKVEGILSVGVKMLLYQLLEPKPEARKSLAVLWEDPWIQKAVALPPPIVPTTLKGRKQHYSTTNTTLAERNADLPVVENYDSESSASSAYYQTPPNRPEATGVQRRRAGNTIKVTASGTEIPSLTGPSPKLAKAMEAKSEAELSEIASSTGTQTTQTTDPTL